MSELLNQINFRFSWLPDYRGDQHWEYLQLEVFHPSEEERLGFLRVAFVRPSIALGMNEERLLVAQSQGHHIYPRHDIRKGGSSLFLNPENWKRWQEDPKHAADYVSRDVMHEGYTKGQLRLKESTKEELIAYVEKNRVHLNEHTQEWIDNFYRFAVNKADVDYISLQERWQGNGIATLMYEKMAQYLDQELGMALHASTTQSKEAQKLWQRLENNGWTDKGHKGRLCFVHNVSLNTLQNRDISPPTNPSPVSKSSVKKKLVCAPKAPTQKRLGVKTP